MHILRDTVLPGAANLHLAEQAHHHAGNPKKRNVAAQPSRGGGVLRPLFRLARDPAGALQDAIRNYNLSSLVGGTEEASFDVDQAYQEEARRQMLHLQLKNATSYDEWRAAAAELDRIEGNETWKHERECAEYDVALVEAHLRQLDEARLNCDVNRMLFLIRTSLTRGLGGMGDLRLYKHSHIGTKALIEEYIDSAQKTIAALLEVSAKRSQTCDSRELLEQLLATRQAFGRSALLLSGGGTFGMNHIGVIKTLWQHRLLPRIISGSSAGSIVCAVLCTRTDLEIPHVLEEFCYGDLDVFERAGEDEGIFRKAARFLKHGVIFDISHLIRVMRGYLGDMTFQEGYNRTRRILNITVSSASLYELPRLLNYITAPNVMIWSAVAASCSVPFVFSAASLRAKDPRTGKEVPWNPSSQQWIDGSVDNDLPMTRLAEMFNVNHFIVSQVNPHVVPFLAKEEDTIASEAERSTSAVAAGPGWLHSMANLAKGEALHRMHVLAEMGIFPNYFTKCRSVLSQRYSGDITIFPEISYTHFPKILSNPTSEFMLQAMLAGEKATWPKMSRIQNHCAIELALDDAVQQLRARVVFSPSQVDLRLNIYGRPLSEGTERYRLRRTSSRASHEGVVDTESRPTSSGKNLTIKHPHFHAPLHHVRHPSISKRSRGALLTYSSSASATPTGLRTPRITKSICRDPPSPIEVPARPSDLPSAFAPSPLPPADHSAISSTDEHTALEDGADSTLSPPSPSSPLSPPSPAGPTTSSNSSLAAAGRPPRTHHLFPSAPATPDSGYPGPYFPTSPLAMTKTPPTSRVAADAGSRPAAGPSSPEQRYKLLFHGPSVRGTSQPPSPSSADTPPPPKKGEPRKRKGELGAKAEGKGTVLGRGFGLKLDISGTRGMMARKRGSGVGLNRLGLGLGKGTVGGYGSADGEGGGGELG